MKTLELISDAIQRLESMETSDLESSPGSNSPSSHPRVLSDAAEALSSTVGTLFDNSLTQSAKKAGRQVVSGAFGSILHASAPDDIHDEEDYYG